MSDSKNMPDGLSKVQKTEVQNEIYKVILAGGLIVTLVSAVVGWASGKAATNAKESELKGLISSTKTSISALNAATEDAQFINSQIRLNATIDGWPAVIKCQDSRTDVPYKLYHYVADYRGKKIYRHIGYKTHQFHFDENAVLRGEDTESGATLLDCENNTPMSDIIANDQAYGLVSMGGMQK